MGAILTHDQPSSNAHGACTMGFDFRTRRQRRRTPMQQVAWAFEDEQNPTVQVAETPWNNWYHCMGNTYGTWLPGDPRGFRTRLHREHVEGDYRNPPKEDYRQRAGASRRTLGDVRGMRTGRGSGAPALDSGVHS